MATTAPTIAGWAHAYSGKVRDLYVPAGNTLISSPVILMVASDRVSAFDRVLEPAIPGKGALLTHMTKWWLRRLPDIPNQIVPVDTNRYPDIPAQLADRTLLCRTLDMFPIECVVRGYLTGSGFREYVKTGTVGGIPLPAGLSDGDRLPEPLYTPAWKAPLGEHDQNVTFERTIELVGEAVAQQLRIYSLEIFSIATKLSWERGLVLVDTKFEFGADRETGAITIADEVLTSDSSRYWDATADSRSESGSRTNFDKQLVRDWLTNHWDGAGSPPHLPVSVVNETATRYRELLHRFSSAT